MKIVVVGGGICGLAFANLLCKEHTVEVYEREEDIDQRTALGYSISIRDGDQKGKTCLEKIGVWDKCCAQYGSTHKVFSILTPSGTITGQFKGNGDPANKFAQLRIHRGELRRALLDSLPPAVCVTWNKKCTGYHQHENSATVHFEDGTTATGDLVLACDGINSKLRAQMLGGPALSDTNNVAAIMGIGKLTVQHPLTDNGGFITAGNGIGVFMAQFRYKGENMCNWALIFQTKTREEFQSILDNNSWEGCAAGTDKLKEKAVSLSQEFRLHEPVPSLIQATDTSQLTLWGAREVNVNHEKSSHWQDGRVLLMGDAAHATTPFGGAGANMALEDALVLSARLSGVQSEGVKDVVKKYVTERFPQTKKQILEAHNMGTSLVSKGWRPYLKLHLPFYLITSLVSPSKTQKVLFASTLVAAAAAAWAKWVR